MIIVSDFQPLAIITKHSILDVAAVLFPPLVTVSIEMRNTTNIVNESFQINFTTKKPIFPYSKFNEKIQFQIIFAHLCHVLNLS